MLPPGDCRPCPCAHDGGRGRQIPRVRDGRLDEQADRQPVLRRARRHRCVAGDGCPADGEVAKNIVDREAARGRHGHEGYRRGCAPRREVRDRGELRPPVSRAGDRQRVAGPCLGPGHIAPGGRPGAVPRTLRGQGHRSRMTSASRLLPVTHPPRKPSIGRAIVPGVSADSRRWESHAPNAERAMASASPAARLPRSTAI